jgi:hypothetical protein
MADQHRCNDQKSPRFESQFTEHVLSITQGFSPIRLRSAFNDLRLRILPSGARLDSAKPCVRYIRWVRIAGFSIRQPTAEWYMT